MHCLRLYFECIDLMENETITLPRPERALLIEVRSGEWSLERFLDKVKFLHERTLAAVERSGLPERVNKEAISKLVADAHFMQWQVFRQVNADERPRLG
jgi:hypothetical protein